MAATTKQRKPTFFWQAALILLPVIVLAVMGWYSLRQDKVLAEHDAKELAQKIANDLLPKIWDELTSKSVADTNHPAFQIDERGLLIFPPPYAVVPEPKPFDLAELNVDQARLWQTLQSADADAQTLKDFIGSHPPENFAASAAYALGLRLVQQTKFLEAAEMFDLVANKYPNAIGESGLPLQPLAQLKMFELEPRARRSSSVRVRINQVNSMPNPAFPSTKAEHFISMDSLCSNLVYHPSPLTPYLLNKISEEIIPEGELVRTQNDSNPLEVGTDLPETVAAIQKWQQAWKKDEVARQLFYLAKSKLPPNSDQRLASRMFWIALPNFGAQGVWKEFLHEHSGVKGRYQELDNRWLVVRRNDDQTNRWFSCSTDFDLAAKVNAIVESEIQLPEYFGVGVQLAEEKITPDPHLWHYNYYVSKGAGQAKKEELDQSAQTVLATAIKPDSGFSILKINVYLTSPEALFQRQRARAFWFGSLVAVSTLAALVGLVAAGRAFRRQLQLSEMKSNFVSSVSHELRAPIASVRLMAENLEREKISEPQKQKEYFAFIGQECRRLTSLIENVLDFSRIEQGRKQYELEPTDIVALVTQTVKLMEPYGVEKGVRLETLNIQRPTPNIELNVDGRAIQQALVNLIDNAIKHSPKGESVMIGMETETQRDPATPNPQPSTLNLSVTDHGPGIPPEEHAKIFERFYRRGSELRRETQGVGIGLSIVKHIVESHGGHVRVESEVGQGSRFTIALPLNNKETKEQSSE